MWINILIGAGCGVIAAIIANLVVPKLTDNKNAVQIATVALMIGLFGLSRATLTPQIMAWQQLKNIDAHISDNVALNALKKYDPDEYNKIMDGLKNIVANGGTEQDAVVVVQTRIQQVVTERLPIASNAAAIQYMRASVKEMAELRAKDPELCYQLLFPEPGKFIDLKEHLSAQTMSEDLAGLASVIRTSAESPTNPPAEDEVLEEFTMVLKESYGVYGEDVLALENPATANISADRFCQITEDLYTRILALPEHKSGPVLRYLLSQK